MPAALQGINWDGIKLAYLQGQGTLRELAQRFNAPLTAVETRASRLKWKQARNQIEQGHDRALSTISQKVTEKVAEKAANQVASHLSSVISSGNGILAKLQSKLEQALLPDITRLDHLESATRSYRAWDDLIRRAHGLADPTSRIDITSGGLPMHEKALALLESCTHLVRSGQVDPDSIDVDGLVLEMEQDKSAAAAPAAPDASTIVEPDPAPAADPVQSAAAAAPSDVRSI